MGAFEYEVRHVLGAAYSGGGVRFAPCGTSMLVALHGRVQHVDLVRGRARTLPSEAGRSLRCMDTRARAVLTVDEAGRAALLGTATGRIVARMTLRAGPVLAARLSPCGRFAAFSSADEVQVWAVPAGGVPEYAAFEKIAVFRACGAAGKGCLEWSADSRRLVVGGVNGVCFLYTVRRREGARGRVKPLVLYGHREAIARVMFCGDRGLLTLSRDGVLFCWRLRYNDMTSEGCTRNVKNDIDHFQTSSEGDENARPGGTGVLGKDSFAVVNMSEDDEADEDVDGSEDGSDVENHGAENAVLVEGDAGVDNRLVVPVEAKLSSRHFVKTGSGRRVRAASIHRGLLAVGMSNGVFALYELPDVMASHEDATYDAGLFELGEQCKAKRKQQNLKRKHAELAHPLPIDSMKNNPEAKLGDDGDGDSAERPPRMRFTELHVMYTLNASAGAISDLEFSPSGDWLAIASAHSGQITVWEWRSETHIIKQQAHVLSASSLAFTPDGRALATGSLDGRVKLWAVATGFCAATFSDHDAAVSAVACAGNDIVVSASLDGTVRAYDIRRYRNFRVLVGPSPRRQFGTVAVDQQGELVAAGCVDTFEIVVWSLRTGSVLEVLSGHKGPVSGIAFRPQHGQLASASWDRTVRLWDMYERKGSCEVLEHSKEALAVSFRPDGKEFAVAAMSGEIMLWDADSGQAVGTIDGARDAAGGRLRDSRTAAPRKGHFQALSYSADGRFLLAGAASKHICVYHVRDGSAPSLVDRYAVTENKNFDGLLDKLNSSYLTAGGYAQEVIQDDPEDDEAYGEAKIAEGRSLPGAESELKTRRKQMIKAEVKCVQFSPTGRMWGAVTTEGVLVYCEAGLNSSGACVGVDSELARVGFDPTDLDEDVTVAAADEASAQGRHEVALRIALRLNERAVLARVMEATPPKLVSLVVSRLQSVHFNRMILMLAWLLETGAHLGFYLSWATRLLSEHGGVAHENTVQDPGLVNSALRALHRAVNAHSKRITPVACRNGDALRYLVSLSETVNSRYEE